MLGSNRAPRIEQLCQHEITALYGHTARRPCRPGINPRVADSDWQSEVAVELLAELDHPRGRTAGLPGTVTRLSRRDGRKSRYPVVHLCVWQTLYRYRKSLRDFLRQILSNYTNLRWVAYSCKFHSVKDTIYTRKNPPKKACETLDTLILLIFHLVLTRIMYS